MPDNSSSQSQFRVGLVQLCSGSVVDRNVSDATDLIKQAAAGGAQYIQTPEVTTLLQLDRDPLFAACTTEEDSKPLVHFRKTAKDLSIWLHIGSMAVLASPTHLANRSYLLAPDGSIAARYDKIHMFDVDLPDGESYCESDKYRAGDKAVLADLPWGKLGMTICYDLRFPNLHRELAQAGAVLLSSPAAFTKTTGQAHWHTLLRARAIEAQCFVLAANQGGEHDNGRHTYGHSLVISPWGEILAEAGTDPTVIFADIDTRQVADVRARVPSLRHDHDFAIVNA